ncbi:DUF6263 family protein [Corynebacterium cystitidis]|uniref:DUF6263 family protein n=1 Tax=Corynebacterium cystitidis TaxID=35757 RepID=UPI00211F0B2F|nr:DUF6263 family protein [Corynebacterium cystitidis]
MSIRAKAPALILPALTAFLLSACGTEPDPVAEVPAFPVDVARVDVIESGQDPQVLAYDDITDDQAKGQEGASSRTAEVENGFAQNVVAANAVDRAASPVTNIDTLALPLEVRTVEAPAPGEGETEATRRVQLTVGQALHSGTDIVQEIDSAAGFLSMWRGTNDGRVSTIKLLAPAEASEDARAAVESGLLSVLTGTVIFPGEPVGVGGSWTVESRVTGGSTMLRTTTYTVTDIVGTEVSLEVSIDQRPAQETLNFDGEQAPQLAGQSLTVESSDTSSAGSIVVDLTEALPVAGRVTTSTRVIYAGADDNFRIVQDQTQSIDWS